ncbi:unnamed protein product [Penicillium camemberti]|uniref:Str. FM013 n=1 Tax=Penicillium camemberti (strain FM 013) TaxID=1429867 RepID=A0A0G4P494_PENC3|nr:unnamed protein product [Penicillium camemberti]
MGYFRAQGQRGNNTKFILSIPPGHNARSRDALGANLGLRFNV